MGTSSKVEDYSQYHPHIAAALLGGFGAVTAIYTEANDRRRKFSRQYKVARVLIGAALGTIVYMICHDYNLPSGVTALSMFLAGSYNKKLVDLVWLQLKDALIERLKMWLGSKK